MERQHSSRSSSSAKSESHTSMDVRNWVVCGRCEAALLFRRKKTKEIQFDIKTEKKGRSPIAVLFCCNSFTLSLDN